MSLQLTLLLATLLPLTVCLAFAYLLVRKANLTLAVLSGLGLIAAVEFYLQAHLRWSVDRCIQQACAAGGLVPNCEAASFGCTEWSGVSAVIFLATGALDLALFLVGITIIAVRERRQSRAVETGLTAG